MYLTPLRFSLQQSDLKVGFVPILTKISRMTLLDQLELQQ